MIDVLKQKSLEFTLSLYELTFMPGKHVLQIQNNIEKQVNPETVDRIIPILGFCKDPFEGCKTEHTFLKKLTDSNLYRQRKQISIDNKLTEIVLKGNPTLGPKSNDVFIMPLAFTVKRIFEIPNILELTLSNIQQNLKCNDLTNLASGEVFKSIAKQFDPDIVVPFVLYIEYFQINSALGSHTFSICGSYINFPLMPRYLLSKVQYIFRAAFIATDKLKKCGNGNFTI